MNDYNFDEMMGLEGKQKEKKNYDKTSKEHWAEFRENLSNSLDWFRIPLNILFVFILTIGAVLMYFSVLSLTGNIFIAILSPTFSELGILAYKYAKERPKNTEKQTEIAKQARDWHIFVTVVLLTLNFIIDSAEGLFSVRIVDGAMFGILVFIGLTALIDIVQFFRYSDADRETIQKREFRSRVEELRAETRTKQLNAFANSEKVKSEALVKFWEENAPKLAEKVGKIQAAAKIKETYSQMGLSEKEVEEIIQKIESSSQSVNQPLQTTPINQDNTKSDTGHPPQTQLPQKRKYTRRQIPPTYPPPTSENIPEKQPEGNKEENFTNGVENTQDDW